MCNNWEEEYIPKAQITYLCHIINLHLDPSHTYTHYYMSRSERSLLAQLRIGVLLPLNVETGRYNNVKVEDRKIGSVNSVILILKTKITLFVLAQYMLIFEKKLFQFLTIQSHRYNNLLVFWMKSHRNKLGQFISKAWMVRRHKLYN